MGTVAQAQDMEVARIVPQVVSDRIANLDRVAWAIVVECSVPVDKITVRVRDRHLELAAGVAVQRLNYAPDNLALHLQYGYLDQLSGVGVLVVYLHHLAMRIARPASLEAVHLSSVMNPY